MPARIFADHCVSTDAVILLRQLGYQVERARETGLHAASDDDIFTHAQKTKQILLTFDKDFGNIVHFDIRRSWGVVIVYLENLSKETILSRLETFLAGKRLRSLAGKLFIIERRGIRIWPKS